MKLTRLPGRPPHAAYACAVDYLLQRRYGTTVAAQSAEQMVAVAWRAGLSPRECADWLAALDGLE